MGSLFTGTPQQAPSYVSSSSETPQWMQDAIYNQINWSQNLANMPYQPYGGTLVAPASGQQRAAWEATTGAQGRYQPYMNAAMGGTQALAGAAGGEAAAAPFLQQAVSANPYQAGQGALNTQAGMLGQIDYSQPVNTLSPFTQQAVQGTQSAAGPVTQNVNSYMNPYNEQVTNRIAQLGARNLSENLLPAVGSEFIKAGQFGSSRMGDFGARAVRDTQEAILGQQAQALQQGYGQALQAGQTDLARQLQAAGQVGALGQQLSGAQQAAIQQGLAGASQYGQMAQTAGNLTNQQQQALLQAGQQAGSLRGADLARQQSALSQLAQQAQQGQQMGYTDIAALESAGQAQQQLGQSQANADYQQYLAAQQYPLERMNFLSSQIRGLAPYAPTQQTQSGYTTTFGQSPLSQLATGLAAGAGMYNLMTR